MSQTPALMQVPTIEQIQEVITIFKAEQSIEQVNNDLVNIITLVGQNLKSPGLIQEDRERLYSYMLQLKNIYRLINDINDIATSQ